MTKASVAAAKSDAVSGVSSKHQAFSHPGHTTAVLAKIAQIKGLPVPQVVFAVLYPY